MSLPIFPGDRVGVLEGIDVEPLLEAYGDEPADVVMIAVPEGRGPEAARRLCAFFGLDAGEPA